MWGRGHQARSTCLTLPLSPQSTQRTSGTAGALSSGRASRSASWACWTTSEATRRTRAASPPETVFSQLCAAPGRLKLVLEPWAGLLCGEASPLALPLLSEHQARAHLRKARAELAAMASPLWLLCECPKLPSVTWRRGGCGPWACRRLQPQHSTQRQSHAGAGHRGQTADTQGHVVRSAVA